MAINFLEDDELGLGVEKGSDNKLTLKLDTSGNVQLTKSDAGLKADVVLPSAFDSTELLNKITELTNKITELENAKQVADEKIKALESRQDIKLANAVVDGTNIKLTLSDGVEVTVDIAKFMNTLPTSEEIWTGLKGVSTFKSDLLDTVKGEEVQNFAGDNKGYLLAVS